MIGESGYYWFVVLLTTEFSIFLANVFQFDLSTVSLHSNSINLLTEQT